MEVSLFSWQRRPLSEVGQGIVARLEGYAPPENSKEGLVANLIRGHVQLYNF